MKMGDKVKLPDGRVGIITFLYEGEFTEVYVDGGFVYKLKSNLTPVEEGVVGKAVEELESLPVPVEATSFRCGTGLAATACFKAPREFHTPFTATGPQYEDGPESEILAAVKRGLLSRSTATTVLSCLSVNRGRS